MSAEDKPRKVAIIGYTFSHRAAPWDSPDWAIWGMNDLHLHIQNTRWDGWVDVHDQATIESNPEHLAWLKQRHEFPIWMMHPSEEYPSAQPFPVEALRRRFGGYFTNTVAWMAALAVEQVEWALGDENGPEIGIWGVDMAVGSEYAAQRPSCEYHIGMARGMGIKVTIAETSDLLKTAGLYGSPESDALRVKLTERITEMGERARGAREEKARAEGHAREMQSILDQIAGATEATSYILGTWVPAAHDPAAGRAVNDVRGAPSS